MHYKRLRAVEDQEFGGLGLNFVVPHKFCNGMFTIQDGLILAHDILEHQQGVAKIGSIGDEMVALGGVCYTRAQWGELRRDSRSYHSPIENVSSDIWNMAQLYFDQGIPFRQKLVTSKCEDPSGIVDDVIENAYQYWNKNVDTDKVVPMALRETYLESCRVYMVHGAKLAHRRFGSGLLANNLFWEIEAATDRTVKSLEYEGQEFTLGYDFKGNVMMQEVYEGDW